MKELVGTILVRVYCMDMSEIIYLVLLLSCVYVWIDQKLQDKWWRKPVVALGLFCFLCVVAYATVVNRSGGHTELPKLELFHTYREVMNGGDPELYRSNFMNAVLFYPVGLLGATLLPKKWPGWFRCLLVTVLLGTMSAGIEYLQLRYALGLCEIDDVIHNTAGTLAGSLAAVLLPTLLGRIQVLLAQICERNSNAS